MISPAIRCHTLKGNDTSNPGGPIALFCCRRYGGRHISITYKAFYDVFCFR